MKRAFLAALLMSSAIPAYAAQIDVNPLGNNVQMIAVVGEIGPNDFDAFKLKANSVGGKIFVFLRGPGGNLLSALQIGEFIRLKGWDTAVFDDCSSACAAIWLAGIRRMMTPNARIGFHAASINGQ